MASLIYNSFLSDSLSGVIDAGADEFKVLLVTSDYTPNKATHNKRDDVTDEITGTGYTAGGVVTTATLTQSGDGEEFNFVSIEFSAVNWSSATITARGAVYYKARGGASSADELVLFNDFGTDVTVTAGTFTIAPTFLSIVNNA
jgi:hypothetical protein